MQSKTLNCGVVDAKKTVVQHYYTLLWSDFRHSLNIFWLLSAPIKQSKHDIYFVIETYSILVSSFNENRVLKEWFSFRHCMYILLCKLNYIWSIQKHQFIHKIVLQITACVTSDTWSGNYCYTLQGTSLIFPQTSVICWVLRAFKPPPKLKEQKSKFKMDFCYCWTRGRSCLCVSLCVSVEGSFH